MQVLTSGATASAPGESRPRWLRERAEIFERQGYYKHPEAVQMRITPGSHYEVIGFDADGNSVRMGRSAPQPTLRFSSSTCIRTRDLAMITVD
jgi:hypothetical protein